MSDYNKRPLISVVVPVYNVAGYLDDCLTSVCGQSYDKLQIILVDDGSTDDSGDECARCASRDPRVEVIHTANSGLSAARNAGMRLVDGDYVIFVDSDDVLGHCHIENLFYAVSRTKDPLNSVAVTSFTSIGDEHRVVGQYCENAVTTLVSLSASQAISTSVTLGERFAAYAWGKLYPRALFPILKYPVGRYYEDQFVTYKIFLAAADIVYEDADDYLYRRGRLGSITLGSRVRELDYLDAIRETLACVSRECPEAVDSVQARYLGCLASGIETARRAEMTDLYAKLFGEALSVRDSALACLTLPRSHWARYALLPLGTSAYGHLLDVKFACQNLPSTVTTKLRWLTHRGVERSNALARYRSCGAHGQHRRAFLVMTPRYRNYGDHLIAYSELRLLREAGWGEVVEIPYEDCDALHKDLGSLLAPGDVVFVTGGGYLGDLWPGLESTVEMVLAGIPEGSPVFFFPQSVYYRGRSIEGSSFARSLTMCRAPVRILARERASYKRLLGLLKEGSVGLSPDVGIFLRREDLISETPDRVPGTALVCIRKDKESLQGRDFGVKLTEALWESGLSIGSIDTHDPVGELKPNQRREALEQVVRRFGEASLVVTNRLHGMVFAMIMGTPCVVLDNVSGKVMGVAEWVKDDYPVVVTDEDGLAQAIGTALMLSPREGGLEGLLESERNEMVRMIAGVC